MNKMYPIQLFKHKKDNIATLEYAIKHWKKSDYNEVKLYLKIEDGNYVIINNLGTEVKISFKHYNYKISRFNSEHELYKILNIIELIK